MLGKLFSKKKEEPKYGPTEPVYPGESFVVGQIETEHGVGITSINHAYDNYPNKRYFPWCAQLLLELKDTNEMGHPTNEEAEVLNELENRIEDFLKKNHKMHFIGRVTRKGCRDLLYYVDHPRLNQEETTKFFDEINSIRRVNFNIDKDPEWSSVSGLLK